MGSFKNIVVAIVGLWAVGTLGEQVCGPLPARTGVGRSSSMAYDDKADWCPGQIEACGFICGGKTVSNSCTLSSSTFACYECECADGITPPLDIYYNTIPQRICSQRISNCAASPSGSFSGQCDAMPKCGSINPDPTPPPPAKIWPSEVAYVEPPAPSVEPIVVPEPVIAAVIEPETTTTSSTTTTSAIVETSTIPIPVALTTSSSTFSTLTTSSFISVITSSVALNTTSSISTSTLVSLSTEPPSTTTATRTSSRTTARSSTTTAVSTSLLQGAAMMTSVPWVVQAAIGVAGFVMVGM